MVFFGAIDHGRGSSKETRPPQIGAMDFGQGHKDVVDPEVRAYIYSLVSAVSESTPITVAELTRL